MLNICLWPDFEFTQQSHLKVSGRRTTLWGMPLRGSSGQYVGWSDHLPHSDTVDPVFDSIYGQDLLVFSVMAVEYS